MFPNYKIIESCQYLGKNEVFTTQKAIKVSPKGSYRIMQGQVWLN